MWALGPLVFGKGTGLGPGTLRRPRGRGARGPGTGGAESPLLILSARFALEGTRAPGISQDCFLDRNAGRTRGGALTVRLSTGPGGRSVSPAPGSVAPRPGPWVGCRGVYCEAHPHLPSVSLMVGPPRGASGLGVQLVRRVCRTQTGDDGSPGPRPRAQAPAQPNGAVASSQFFQNKKRTRARCKHV